MKRGSVTVRARLVQHVQELERLEAEKKAAAAAFSEALEIAAADGFDSATLRAVLKLRKMTPSQRKERRALEAIYLATLGLLDGDPLPDEARRRLDAPPPPPAGEEDADDAAVTPPAAEPAPAPAPPPQQVEMPLKDPAEARDEGRSAAAAGKKVYENPYPAGNPCRAAWDEGWCESSGSHGLDIPSAFQRRKEKPEKPPKDGGDAGGEE